MSDISYDLQTGDEVNEAIMLQIKTAVNSKVDKDGSKVLSDNNFTTAQVNKLANVPSNTNVELGNKQATLESGVNIKTINGNTLLGSGNIVIADGVDGQDGANGSDGADGAPGADGAAGATGPQGPIGLSGTYLGYWNAATNSPTLTTTPSTAGDFYQVNAAGTQSVTGASEDFAIGDYLVSDGTDWFRMAATAVNLTTVISGNQLFDKDTMVTQGMQVSEVDGSLYVYGAGTNQAYAEIPIPDGTTAISINNWNQSGYKIAAFYDVTDTIISFTDGEDENITVPSGAVTLKISVKLGVADESQYQTLMVSPTTTKIAYAAPTYAISAINGMGIYEPVEVESFSMADADSIMFFGCSYLEGNWTLKSKDWLSLLQDYINYRCVNHGYGSHRLTDITAHFRDNDVIFGVEPHAVGARYAFIANIGNQSEDMNAQALSLDFYATSARELIEAVRDKGMEPILSTDWLTGPPVMAMVLADLARELRVPFYDIGSWGQRVVASAAAGNSNYFFGLGHPGTRMVTYNAFAHLYFFHNYLPEPKQAIWLGRPRFTVTEIQQLNYDNLLDRPRKWQSVRLGHVWIQGEYDNLTLGPTGGSQTDEYHGMLQAGTSVAFTDYALIEVQIPTVEPDLCRIKVEMAQAVGTDFYLKDFAHYNDPYTAFGAQSFLPFYVTEAEYNAITVADGDLYAHSDETTPGSMNLRMYGKMVDWRFGGYTVVLKGVGGAGFATNSGTYPGTLTKVSGTGSATITIGDIVKNRRYTWDFRNQMLTPQGELEAASASYSDGHYIISASNNHIQGDKVVLVVNKSGAFNISNVVVEYRGGTEKLKRIPDFKQKDGGTELLAQTYFDTNSLTSGIWDKPADSNAAIGQTSATYRNYPTVAAITHHLSLPLLNDNLPSKAYTDLTFTAANYERKLIVRTISQLFPKVYSAGYSVTSETTNVPQITSASYDHATLCVSITEPFDPVPGSGDTHSTPVVLKGKTGIGWCDQYFEVPLPPYQSALRLELFRDALDTNPDGANNEFDMQVAFVSVSIK